MYKIMWNDVESFLLPHVKDVIYARLGIWHEVDIIFLSIIVRDTTPQDNSKAVINR